jgi:hypothetical protein
MLLISRLDLVLRPLLLSSSALSGLPAGFPTRTGPLLGVCKVSGLFVPVVSPGQAKARFRYGRN